MSEEQEKKEETTVTPTVTPTVVEAKTKENTEVTPTVTPEVEVAAPVDTEASTKDVEKPPEKPAVAEVDENESIEAGNDGNTIAAKSSEAMAVAEAKGAAKDEDEDEDEEFFPSFFIEEDDRHEVEVDCLFDKETKHLTSCSRNGLPIDFSKYKYLRHTLEKLTFSVPDYEDIAKYRQRSTVYRRESGTPVVDGVQLRNHLLIWHLKDWSLRDRKGKKVELKFEESGALTDESIAKVYSLPNGIVDVVLTIFERDVLLSE
jgi:hypothetical protein